MKGSGYLQALETRLKWLRWLETTNGWQFTAQLEAYIAQHMASSGLHDSHSLLERILGGAEGTYYVTTAFGQLVDQLAEKVPESLTFHHEWLQSRSGFLLLEKPFQRYYRHSSDKELIDIRALGWTEYNERQIICVAFYQAPWLQGGSQFGIASLFKLTEGERLGQILGELLTPNTNGNENPDSEPRYLYSLLYLLSEKLTVVSQHEANRSQRRRLEQEQAPFVPLVQVVTLRRQEVRQKDKHDSNPVDWSYQWLVRWHWRNQYYPATDEHKWIAIDTYVKGPEDKPLKPPSARMFLARR